MGLAVHPDDEMFATAGHDKNIALWKGHKLIFATQVRYEQIRGPRMGTISRNNGFGTTFLTIPFIGWAAVTRLTFRFVFAVRDPLFPSVFPTIIINFL